MATPNWYDNPNPVVLGWGEDGEGNRTPDYGDIFKWLRGSSDPESGTSTPDDQAAMDWWSNLSVLPNITDTRRDPQTNHWVGMLDGQQVNWGMPGSNSEEWRPGSIGQARTMSTQGDTRFADVAGRTKDGKVVFSSPIRSQAPPAASSSNFFDDIWENPVVMAGLSAFLGPQIAGVLGGAGLSAGAAAAGSGAILGGGRAALTGGDIGRGALMGGLGGAAINGLGGALGDSGALAGGDLGAFDYPTLTGAEMQAYGAPASGMSAVDQITTGPQFANNVTGVSDTPPVSYSTGADDLYDDWLGNTDRFASGDPLDPSNLFNSMSGPSEYGGGGGYGTSTNPEILGGGGAFGPGSIAAAAGAGTAGSWSALAKEALGYAGPAMAIGSALYGFDKAGDLRDSVAGARDSMINAVKPIPGLSSIPQAAAAAQASANPWQTSGGTDLATTQLKNFMRSPDPSMQVGTPELDPAFAARIQGAQRATANYGQDSGNMAVAGANASSTWYNERLQQLANLAGAPGNPVGAAQLGLQGQSLGLAQQQLQLQAATGGASNSLEANKAANDLVSRSLASGAYGATRLAGGSTQFTPAMLEALRRAGITFTGMPS